MTDATPLASEQITQDADELEALIGKATEHDLADEGRYFSETCNDLTSCRHGETGEYNDQHDGRLVEFLWNHRHHYLSLLRSAALSATPAPSDQDASQAQGEVVNRLYEMIDGFADFMDFVSAERGKMRGRARAYAAMIEAEAAPGATAQDGMEHPDDVAVDLFAARMKGKLSAARAKGRGGWDDPAQCSTDYLRTLLHEHVAKGDPVDVANFCMMLAHYGASTTPLAAAPKQAEQQGVEALRALEWLAHCDNLILAASKTSDDWEVRRGGGALRGSGPTPLAAILAALNAPTGAVEKGEAK